MKSAWSETKLETVETVETESSIRVGVVLIGRVCRDSLLIKTIKQLIGLIKIFKQWLKVYEQRISENETDI